MTRLRQDARIEYELVRATEAAAIAAGRLVGRGDKNAIDAAAVDAMRAFLGEVDIAGTVVIGEGEKDEAPMLFIGEYLGTGDGPALDVAVDPIDGTTLAARGGDGAIAVVAPRPVAVRSSTPTCRTWRRSLPVRPDAGASRSRFRCATTFAR
jgi:fructose-1,6-bisphosphatase II